MRAILFLTAIFLAPVGALSQSTEPMKTKALSFGFDGAGSVGGKIWISDLNALTVSVGGVVSSTTNEAADTSEIDDEYSSSNVNLMLGVERHFDLGWDFSPYVTGGLSIGSNGYENRSGSSTVQYKSVSRSTSLGVHAGVGVEYWVARRISLAGRQYIAGTYRLGKYSSGLADSPSRDTHSFDLGLGTSALILSVYL